MDEITERINAAVSRRGMFKTTAAQLIGMTPQTWYTRQNRGNWRTSEVQRIAEVLRVPFAWLAGLEDSDAA